VSGYRAESWACQASACALDGWIAISGNNIWQQASLWLLGQLATVNRGKSPILECFEGRDWPWKFPDHRTFQYCYDKLIIRQGIYD